MPQSAVKLAVMMAHTGPDVKIDFHGTWPFYIIKERKQLLIAGSGINSALAKKKLLKIQSAFRFLWKTWKIFYGSKNFDMMIASFWIS